MPPIMCVHTQLIRQELRMVSWNRSPQRAMCRRLVAVQWRTLRRRARRWTGMSCLTTKCLWHLAVSAGAPLPPWVAVVMNCRAVVRVTLVWTWQTSVPTRLTTTRRMRRMRSARHTVPLIRLQHQGMLLLSEAAQWRTLRRRVRRWTGM